MPPGLKEQVERSPLTRLKAVLAAASLVLAALAAVLTLAVSPASAASPTAPTIKGGSTATVQLVQDDLPLSDYYTGGIQISSSGTPTPTLTMTSGTLPPGLTFTPNIFGGALITGSSPPSAAGTYTVTVTSSNGVAPDAIQHVMFVFATTKTTTTLSVSPNAVFQGQPVTLTATVSPIPNGGTVTFTHECGGPKPVNIVTGTATCTAAIAPNAGLPTNYNGFGVFAPSVATNPVALHVYSPSFWLATANGRVLGYEDAKPLGDATTSAASGPVVGMASTADGKGYWVATANGGVSAIGDAPSYGDLPALGKHVSDIVAITATPDFKGYYLVGADGGFFTFGDAKFHGSIPGLGIRTEHIVGMVASPTGSGYLLVGWDGGVFTFGTAHFHGSLPGLGIHVKNIRGAILSSTATGYALVGSDGGVFTFGTGVKFHGSLPGEHIRVSDIVGIALTPDDKGYWMASASQGGVFGFGNAQDYGRAGTPDVPVAAITAWAPGL